MTTRRQLATAPRLLCALGALLLAALVGCGSEPEATAPVETYRVRAMVRQLPARAGGEMQVRHEAIPTFKNADGEVVGMESMTMPFPMADDALVAGIAAGDRIEIEFEVRWQGGHPLRITAIDKLPPDARLAFEEPAPEAEAPPAEAPADEAAAPSAEPEPGESSPAP